VQVLATNPEVILYKLNFLKLTKEQELVVKGTYAVE
jgi:hypothetical protein